jgi:hypothetical protein
MRQSCPRHRRQPRLWPLQGFGAGPSKDEIDGRRGLSPEGGGRCFFHPPLPSPRSSQASRPKTTASATPPRPPNTEIRSLLEWAGSENLRSAVVMVGARTFEGFVKMMMGVPKSLDSRDFDREILAPDLRGSEKGPEAPRRPLPGDRSDRAIEAEG